MEIARHAFWQAFLAAVLVFVTGLLLGFFLESGRIAEVQHVLYASEVNVLDEQLRGRLLTDLSLDCSLAKNSSFQFADTIYAEAQQLELYDAASKFSDSLQIVHKRYDLLRMLLWSESMQVRERCQEGFHTIVYFYNYTHRDSILRAQQTTFSRLLTDLKEAYPEDILLIPIALDSDLASVKLAQTRYGITSVPSILIDEQIVVDRVVSSTDLRTRVFSLAVV